SPRKYVQYSYSIFRHRIFVNNSQIAFLCIVFFNLNLILVKYDIIWRVYQMKSIVLAFYFQAFNCRR
ncbi:hypothetical protein L9F63_010786, partial [Diploptera punctata]